MKRIIAICFILMMMVGCTKVDEVENIISFDDEDIVLENSEIRDLGNKTAPIVTELGMEMINKILENKSEGNVLVSPLSLSIALEMLQNVADGETKEQILNVIGRKSENKDFSSEFINSINSENKAIMTYLNGKNNDVLKIAVANSIWMRDDMTFQKNFVDILSSSYDAQSFNVNFIKKSTINDMNQWVEDKTNGMLKDTIKSLDPQTLLVLMNTVYFKGIWENEFLESNTQEKDFYVTSDMVKKVDMMYQKENFQYYEDKECQIIHLPYKEDMDMIVILPSDSVESFFNELSSKEMKAIINQDETSLKDVKLSLPKFEYEVNNKLNEFLQKMGMIKAFDESNAEFNKIIEEDEQVWISKVFQNAKIILDEKGTEAAAVTVVELKCGCAMEVDEPIVMNCDRPFFFVIKDNMTGIPLFMGVYSADEIKN